MKENNGMDDFLERLFYLNFGYQNVVKWVLPKFVLGPDVMEEGEWYYFHIPSDSLMPIPESDTLGQKKCYVLTTLLTTSAYFGLAQSAQLSGILKPFGLSECDIRVLDSYLEKIPNKIIPHKIIPREEEERLFSYVDDWKLKNKPENNYLDKPLKKEKINYSLEKEKINYLIEYPKDNNTPKGRIPNSTPADESDFRIKDLGKPVKEKNFQFAPAVRALPFTDLQLQRSSVMVVDTMPKVIRVLEVLCELAQMDDKQEE